MTRRLLLFLGLCLVALTGCANPASREHPENMADTPHPAVSAAPMPTIKVAAHTPAPRPRAGRRTRRRRHRPTERTAVQPAGPPTLDQAVSDLQARCGPGVTSDQLIRVANKVHDIMEARGVEESPASITEHVASTIPAGYEPGQHVTDLFAAYATLRLDGGSQ